MREAFFFYACRLTSLSPIGIALIFGLACRAEAEAFNLAIEGDAPHKQCLQATFTHSGDEHWQDITITLASSCNKVIYLTGLNLQFEHADEIGAIWFSSQQINTYPEISLTSYGPLHSVVLSFPEHGSPITIQPQVDQLSLHYGARAADFVASSIKVSPSFAQAGGTVLTEGNAAALNPATQDTVALPKTPFSASPPVPLKRVIGYLPLNWNNSGHFAGQLHEPEDLANSGYTHVLISFGVFSTSPACSRLNRCIQLTPEMDQIAAVTSGDGSQVESLPNYIHKLQKQGIKVLLSIGGASASFGTANFAEAFNIIQNSKLTYRQTVSVFVDSLLEIIGLYGFDGIDIDIEHGLIPGTNSNLREASSVQRCEAGFSRMNGLSPATGSVCAMVSIIEELVRQRPESMITMAPQTLNISANNRIEGQVLNYSSLIARVKNHLSWVGVQVYNSGEMYDPYGTLQAVNAANLSNASIAMAINLTHKWNQHSSQRFLDNKDAILRPDQVVLGFAVSNGKRADGFPAADLEQVTAAVNCLNHARSCSEKYVTSRLKAPLGGVFIWNVNFDRATGYKFARTFSD